MLARTLGQCGTFSVFRGACALSTTARVQGLEEIIPKFPKEGEQMPSIGAAIILSSYTCLFRAIGVSWSGIGYLIAIFHLLMCRPSMGSQRFAKKIMG